MRQKKQKWNPGDILEIPLGDGMRAFARVLKSPLMAFYDLKADKNPPIDFIISKPIAFKVWVMNSVVTAGEWQIIGHAPLAPELEMAPSFFKRDSISGKLSIYTESGGKSLEKDATLEECEKLECAAVWSSCHIADRLNDHFVERPNKWVESTKPRPKA